VSDRQVNLILVASGDLATAPYHLSMSLKVVVQAENLIDDLVRIFQDEGSISAVIWKEH
jgi:hypothetical protein